MSPTTTPLKVCHLTALRLYERLVLVLIFANQKKSKEEFCFYGKRQTVTIADSVRFAVSLAEATQPEWQVWCHRRGPSLTVSRFGTLNCIFGISLFYLNVMYLLVRCVMRYEKNLEEVILGVCECMTPKCFHIN